MKDQYHKSETEYLVCTLPYGGHVEYNQSVTVQYLTVSTMCVLFEECTRQYIRLCKYLVQGLRNVK